MEYDIKRGHFKNIEGDGLKNLMIEIFGDATEINGAIITNFGAMKELRVKVVDRSILSVETESEMDVSDDVAIDTIRRFNEFLEAATGFNSKQRKDRLNKKAKKGKL
jgi:hypothetical protein